jgi:hypothetical protein
LRIDASFCCRSLHLAIEQARREHGHRLRAIAMLRPSSWHSTTMPVARCVIRTAESVLLMCCPPAPDDGTCRSDVGGLI